jgi:hypothetical protein
MPMCDHRLRTDAAFVDGFVVMELASNYRAALDAGQRLCLHAWRHFLYAREGGRYSAEKTDYQ